MCTLKFLLSLVVLCTRKQNRATTLNGPSSFSGNVHSCPDVLGTTTELFTSSYPACVATRFCELQRHRAQVPSHHTVRHKVCYREMNCAALQVQDSPACQSWQDKKHLKRDTGSMFNHCSKYNILLQHSMPYTSRPNPIMLFE